MNFCLMMIYIGCCCCLKNQKIEKIISSGNTKHSLNKPYLYSSYDYLVFDNFINGKIFKLRGLVPSERERIRNIFIRLFREKNFNFINYTLMKIKKIVNFFLFQVLVFKFFQVSSSPNIR